MRAALKVGFILGILICPVRTIADRTAKAADQELLITGQLQVHVRAALHMGEVISLL